MFKPMLAGSFANDGAMETIEFPCYVSPKLDGIRATVQQGRVMSRSLKGIPNKYVQSLFGTPFLEGLDGELTVGLITSESVFRTTESAVMTDEGEPEVTFNVFDWYAESTPGVAFENRYKVAGEVVAAFPSGRVVLVPHTLVHNLKELLSVEKMYLDAGYEGLMKRSLRGPYKQGRSTEKEGYLIKLKRFVDGEAVILDTVEKLHNGNEAKLDELGHMKRSSHKANKTLAGTLGKLTVQDCVSGIIFNIGTGFDDAFAAKVWADRGGYVGRTVKYKHQLCGAKTKPRLPVFLGLRNAMDM